MPLPGSGTLTIGNIATEFGGSVNHNLTEYLRGGAYVPNTPSNAAVPTAVPIKITDFYNTSNLSASVPSFSLDDSNDSSSGSQIIFYANGVYHGLTVPGITISGTWKTGGGVGSDYEIRCVKDSGDNLDVSSSANNTYLGMGSTRQWSLSSETGIKAVSLTIDIRMAASPFTVLDTEIGSLSANPTGGGA